MKYLIYLLGLISILVLQGVKWWVVTYDKKLVYINHNYIFGMIGNLDIVLWVAIVLLLVFISITIKKPNVYALILMFVGAISNLIDRIVSGGVVDYFQIGFLRFNLADILLTIGAIIYGYKAFCKNKN